MSRYNDDRYDEIKSLIKKSKYLNEQNERINIGKSIENKIKDDTGYETADSDEEKEKKEAADDKVQKYKIGGGILAIHGKNKEKLQTRLQTYTEWNVDGFVKAITSKIGELPFGMIFDDRYYYTGSEPARKKYLQISIYKLIQIIEQLKTDGAEEETKKETDTEEVVKDVFHKVYGKENVPSFSNFLDKEAHKVDRKITKQKIEITQEGGIDLSSFVKSIKKFNFFDKLKNLKEKLTDSKTVTGLFPGHITGLFVVSINNWKYIPRDQMGNYVEITRITQSKPKIKLKGMQAPEDENV